MGPDCSNWSWDKPCWGRLVNFTSIQIHIHTHVPHIIRYNNYVESNWSELIYVVTASGGYNWLWVSNNLSPKKIIVREIEGFPSLQRNFTWSFFVICHWIVTYNAFSSYKFFWKLINLKCNFPFLLTLKLPCLTGAGYPKSSRCSNRITFRFCDSWATFLLLLNFSGTRSWYVSKRDEKVRVKMWYLIFVLAFPPAH